MITNPTPTVSLRRPTHDDFWMLLAWRMDPDTAYWSFRPPPTAEAHQRWLHFASNDPDHYVATHADDPCALVVVNHDLSISINVNPLMRRRGIGQACVRELQRLYTILEAWVVVGNTHALHMFTACDFAIIDADMRTNRPCVLLRWELGP